MSAQDPKYPIILRIKPSENQRTIMLKAEALLRDNGVPEEDIKRLWRESVEIEEIGYGHLIDFFEKQFIVEYGEEHK